MCHNKPMKFTCAIFALASILCGKVAAQDTNLAGAYYHFTLAKMHEIGQEFSEAIARFEKAIELDPESADLRVEFANTLIRAGEINRAREECHRVVELDPQDPEPHYLLGQIHFNYRQGREESLVEKAISEFERVIELSPEYFQALYYLGRLYLVQKSYGKAVDTFTRFSSLQPVDPRGYYFKAFAQTELSQIDQALSTLEKSLGFRVDVENLKLLGSLYERTNQSGKALETYQRALQESPAPEIGRRVAFLLATEGRYSEAIPLLEDLAARRPQNVEIRLELGRALMGAKKYSDAAELVKAILEDEPENMEANYELARTLSELGDRHQAIEKFLELLEMDSSSRHREHLQTQLGLLYQQTRQYDKATAIFRELSAKSPQNPFARLRLVHALRDGGRTDEAVKLSGELLRDRPEDQYAILARAQVLSEADRLDSAIQLLEKTIEGNAETEPYYLQASQLYVEHKKYELAQKMVQKGLQTESSSEAMRFQLGAVYERQEKFAEAETQFQAILGDDPAHSGALNYLGYMLAEQGVRLQEALVHIKKAVELDPYNGAYLDSLGWAYFKLDHLALAERYLRQAVRLNDADATIHEHLGDVYYKLGQYEEAREHYEQSVSFSKEADERKKVRLKLVNLNKLLSKRDR